MVLMMHELIALFVSYLLFAWSFENLSTPCGNIPMKTQDPVTYPPDA